jgi:hypothetical protein
MHRAAREVVALVEAVAASAGLTATELDVLGVLVDRAPSVVAGLLDESGYKPSTLTSILDRLAARGWVSRDIPAIAGRRRPHRPAARRAPSGPARALSAPCAARCRAPTSRLAALPARPGPRPEASPNPRVRERENRDGERLCAIGLPCRRSRAMALRDALPPFVMMALLANALVGDNGPRPLPHAPDDRGLKAEERFGRRRGGCVRTRRRSRNTPGASWA